MMLTSRGIAVNNILTACILAAILWVGSSIMQIKETIGQVHTITQLNQQSIEYQEEKLESHVKDRLMHQ